MGRTPTIAQVAQLSRDEWEDLCCALCVIVYGAEAVEDRRGRGNGLDAWRHVPEGLEGFQARRFNDRFGVSQAAKLKGNALLALERSRVEFKAPLKRYILMTNIDLEPGHGAAEGEIERYARLRGQLMDEHDLRLEVHGVTWVHTRLLENPKLRPEMFEDIAAQMLEMERRMTARLEPTVQAQQRAQEAADRLGGALAVLLREGRVHHERGVAHHRAEELTLASRSYRDALNLIAELNIDETLRGQVELLLANTETQRGRLQEAERVARDAVMHLADGPADDLNLARGNLGVLLSRAQNFEEAETELRAVLDYCEKTANQVEKLRTLTHLFELELNRRLLARALTWVPALEAAAQVVDDALGPTQEALAARGALATGLVRHGLDHDDDAALRLALGKLAVVEEVGRRLSSKHFVLGAKSGRAQALWYLDRATEARELFESVAAEAWPEMGKVSADSLYNAALANFETADAARSVELLQSAARRYEEIGDPASAADARARLKEISAR